MNEVLREIARNNLGADYSENLIGDFPDTGSRNAIYILSNTAGIYGAALLYNGVLKDLAEKVEKDLLILPSSIHETFLIPYENSLVISDMADMVRHINQTEVSEKDMLSDNVYRYSRETGWFL